MTTWNPRALAEARAREDALIAWRERRRDCPETGAPGILRDEWRIRLLGDPGLSYDEVRRVLLPACEVRENILEHRYIRRGAVEPWTIHDVADNVDELLGCIPGDAVALLPRLIELRGDAAAAEKARLAILEQTRLAEAAADEKRRRDRAHWLAWGRMQREGSERNQKLAAEWVAYVERVRAGMWAEEGEGRLAWLLTDAGFRASADAVYAATTIPGIARAIKAHLKTWGGVGL